VATKLATGGFARFWAGMRGPPLLP